MPLVIVPVLIGMEMIILVLVRYGLLHGLSSWLRSLLGFLFANHQSFWKRVILWPFKIIATGVLKVEHAVAHSLSFALALTLIPFTGFLNGSAVILEELGLHLGSFAEATYDAFNVLRHITVPRLIRTAVEPVAKLATLAEATATAVTRRLNYAETVFLGALSVAGIGSFVNLGNGLVGLVQAFKRLFTKVWGDVVPKLERAITVSIPKLQTQMEGVLDDLYRVPTWTLPRMRRYLQEVEDFLGKTLKDPLAWVIGLLGSAAGVVALEAVLAKVAPDLFCRNTKNVTKRLCGLDTALLESILGLSLAWLTVLDPVAIAEAALTAEGVMEPVIRQTAG